MDEKCLKIEIRGFVGKKKKEKKGHGTHEQEGPSEEQDHQQQTQQIKKRDITRGFPVPVDPEPPQGVWARPKGQQEEDTFDNKSDNFDHRKTEEIIKVRIYRSKKFNYYILYSASFQKFYYISLVR